MRAFRVVAVVCALVTPVAVVAQDLIGFALSSRAEACCAAMRGECAGLSTPDTCCQTQHVASSVNLGSTRPGLPRIDIAAPIAVLDINSQAGFGTPEGLTVSDSFKRPHDPPHLHRYPLLI